MEAGESELSLVGVFIDRVVIAGEIYAFDLGSDRGGRIVSTWYGMIERF